MAEFLVDEKLLDPSALSVLITQTDLQLPELEVQRQIQLEKNKIRTGRKNKNRAVGAGRKNAERKFSDGERKIRNGGTNSKRKIKQTEKERQYNLRMKELEIQDKVKTKPLDLGTHFGVTKHIRLVPPFQEKEVDKYFLHFEKVAENLKWPKRAFDHISAERCNWQSS